MYETVFGDIALVVTSATDRLKESRRLQDLNRPGPYRILLVLHNIVLLILFCVLQSVILPDWIPPPDEDAKKKTAGRGTILLTP